MAFDTSAVSQWNNEVSDRKELIMTPILAAKTMDYVKKFQGITGENVKLPTFETTSPWQDGSGCGNTTSGTTTINQFTMTTSPIKIYEEICLNDLETKFTKEWLPKGTSQYTDVDIVDNWVSRKLAVNAKQIESALWQAKTTYTNATWLKRFNGFISTLDTAANFVTATAQSSITVANVIGIFDDIIFSKLLTIPQVLSEKPVVFCSMEDFMLLVQAIKNLGNYHFTATGADFDKMEMIYPGTSVKIIAVPGLNSTNPVDSGSLPTAVKHRIVATFMENLCVGFNAENDTRDARVWYSEDDEKLKMKLRFHLGVGIKFTNLCVVYANS